MARRKRDNQTFNLSFLDVMCCGFGAVILIFLLIDHDRQKKSASTQDRQAQQVNMTFFIEESEHELDLLRSELAQMIQQAGNQEDEIKSLLEKIRKVQTAIADYEKNKLTAEENTRRLQRKIKRQKKEQQAREELALENQQKKRKFTRKSSRETLSGFQVKGRRLLILVDISASMLDEKIVNVLRRRNMAEELKRAAPKWQRTLRTLDWLETQMLPGMQFQIYTFNSKAEPALPETNEKWITFDKGKEFQEATDHIKTLVPTGGTSLISAFAKARVLKPTPDSLILLTDSLPTQGARPPRRSRVSGKERLRHFDAARGVLPGNLSVNTILFPMEGDPQAASAYWTLALSTSGSFITPSSDWP